MYEYVNFSTGGAVFIMLIFLLRLLFGFPCLGWQAIGQGQHSWAERQQPDTRDQRSEAGYERIISLCGA